MRGLDARSAYVKYTTFFILYFSARFISFCRGSSGVERQTENLKVGGPIPPLGNLPTRAHRILAPQNSKGRPNLLIIKKEITLN